MAEHRSSRRRRSSSNGGSEGRRSESSVFNRISSSASARTRRVVLFLVGVWFGGVLMVGLLAPSTFKAVDDLLMRKTENVTRMIKLAEQPPVRQLMRDEASEINRRMFDMWGWIQFGLGSIVLVLLVFRSNAGKPALGMAGGAWVFTGLMNFVILPLISGNVSRERFQLLHTGFVVFQLAVLLLLCALLYLLFQRRQSSGEKPDDLEPYRSVSLPPPPPAGPEG